MEPAHRAAISNNLDFLIENTSDEAFQRILEKFSCDDGLSPFMLQKINVGTSYDEKKRKFYEMVPKRGPRAFHKLCECFYSVGLKDLAEKLKSSRLFADGCYSSKLNGSSDIIENANEVRYVIKSNPKGYVLIINIMNYYWNEEDKRNGSEKDVASLEELWNFLGYKVIVHQDLNCEKFQEVIVDFIAMTQNNTLDSVFVFIMTHGKQTEKNKRGVDLKMSDSQFVTSEWILETFNSIKSQHLALVPKVIIIQACRGSNHNWGFWKDNDTIHKNVVDTDSTDAVHIPHFTNLLMVFSTLPGCVSKRFRDSGAPFIQELCKVIRKRYKSKHLLDIIDEVNRNLVEEVKNEGSPLSHFQIIHYENWFFICKLYL